MGYLGTSPSQYEQTLEVRSDVFSANGTQTTYTLTYAVNKTTDIEVVVANTQLNPHNSSYTVSGTTLTISPAVSAGSNNVYVTYRNHFLTSPSPGTSTVITDYIAPLAVTTGKLADEAVTSSKISQTITLGNTTVSGPSSASNTFSLNTRASSANHATQKRYVDAMTIIFGA
mgnify:CR=1 FL=1